MKEMRGCRAMLTAPLLGHVFFFFRVVSCAFTRGRSVPMTDFHSKNILHHLSLCIFHYGGDIASLFSTPTFCL